MGGGGVREGPGGGAGGVEVGGSGRRTGAGWVQRWLRRSGCGGGAGAA